jgi:hypothetical protein
MNGVSNPDSIGSDDQDSDLDLGRPKLATKKEIKKKFPV